MSRQDVVTVALLAAGFGLTVAGFAFALGGSVACVWAGLVLMAAAIKLDSQ